MRQKALVERQSAQERWRSAAGHVVVEEGVPVKRMAERRRKVNRTGLPDRLKAGVEALSGLSMDDVRVHQNSSKPAQLQALAYTQATDIFVGPGQERHLPHEVWHVVQQKQGRVRATAQHKDVGINDDAGLEAEADKMGARAAQGEAAGTRRSHAPQSRGNDDVQRWLTIRSSPNGWRDQLLGVAPMTRSSAAGGVDSGFLGTAGESNANTKIVQCTQAEADDWTPLGRLSMSPNFRTSHVATPNSFTQIEAQARHQSRPDRRVVTIIQITDLEMRDEIYNVLFSLSAQDRNMLWSNTPVQFTTFHAYPIIESQMGAYGAQAGQVEQRRLVLFMEWVNDNTLISGGYCRVYHLEGTQP